MTTEEVKATIPDILDKYTAVIEVWGSRMPWEEMKDVRKTCLISIDLGGWWSFWTELLQSVYELGGRYFWIHNTGPFGCLPYVLDRFPLRAPEVDRIGCGAPFNGVAQLFNSKLKETVIQLRKQFPLAVFTYVDVYTVKYSLISQAKKYGKTSYQWQTKCSFKH